MLATSYALIGENVDIVTSSKILAQRDSSNDPKEGYKIFFNLFGLNVNNNCDNACDNSDTGESERKKRYLKNEIIYGETGYFQRDILLTKCFCKNICEKIAHTLIVDEVDNMFIDNANKMLHLSHNIVDMRYLRDLFLQIWVCVNNKIEQYYNDENVDKIRDYILKMIENNDIKVPLTLNEYIKFKCMD
ncbi:unnamed protein product [Didymodactylos carnosus]|uniref:SecA family profile domain-containing protein n=1 Tax=Didymodactylos carnosus TaxID=1234261 RepID=A0A815WPC0_9BILA|nr:unnamed protein product [Didymodactylos carnosus]CAF4403891.1 unnamed protein product [Didymodactylos carnosus]